jgi:hypothetical protein
MWFIVFSVFEKNFVHVCACILEQFIGRVEDDQCDFTVTQDAQLISFLHQTKLPLCKRNLKKEKHDE